MTYVAVDIGATNIRVAHGDENGLNGKLSEVTDRGHGPEGVPAQIIRMIKELGIDNFLAVGVGSIGPIDLKIGYITETPNYPFNHIPVTGPLTEEFNVPARIVNDCAAAVLGEQTFGAGKGLSNLVYVTLSTGLGGGAIVDGHLLMGKDGNAPEIGHLTIDPDSPLVCGCGGRGHWEAYSSGANIPKFARELLKEMDAGHSLLMELAGSPEAITSEMVFEAAKKGDHVALRIVEEVGRVNAVGFANIVNAFDPELITVGGSIALNNPELILNPIHENIDRHLINRRPEIMITPLGEDAVLYGALALAIKMIE